MKSRVLLLILAAIVVAAALVFAARPLTLLADRVATVRVESLPAAPIGWDGSALFIGTHRMSSLQAPDYTPAAQLQVDSRGRLVLSAGGQSFVLGLRAGVMSADAGDGVPAFAPEPGDEASVTIERSWLGWPTPFDFNFMTGHSPSWRRAVYTRLVWTKPSGARLEMLWRFEQYFYGSDGWTAAAMTREDWSGLARVDIRPGTAAVPPR